MACELSMENNELERGRYFNTQNQSDPAAES